MSKSVFGAESRQRVTIGEEEVCRKFGALLSLF